MRILEVAGSGVIGLEQMGPVSEVVCNLSNQFQGLGHDVTVIDARSEQRRPRLKHGICLVETPTFPRAKLAGKVSSNKIRFLLSWIHEIQFTRFIRSLVRLEQYDVIHVHEHIPALLLARHCAPRMAYTAHTPVWLRDARFKSFTEMMYERFERQFKIHESDLIQRCALTIGLGDYLRSASRRPNMDIIPNGIDLSQWRPMDKNTARDSLGVGPEEFLILSVARIDPIKGLDVLLQAAKELTRRLKGFRILVIGSPAMSGLEYAQSIYSQAEGLPVRFVGYVPNRSEDFRAYLSSADLFVLTSLFDAQGMVILEALAMGLPVVASQVGGISQMVDESVGSLFAVGDGLDLAGKIEYLFRNRTHLERMRGNCRRYVETHYTWEITAEKYLNAFERMCARRQCAG